ncbi:ATP-binding protein [Aliiglaciecola sp. CAU 1673]|uniref:ATP-binding protein n=1 Tax=Aliiglaciecola sp. CAU 1673 TaxID=3032595 RepID=UPI0023D9DB09|nr:ATP-binding protein [Aliiglaciecola sp. CAU 1673]MDF2177350.1 ATP-binding protein [Aliiglaciecola sp. CAU 1673]
MSAAIEPLIHRGLADEWQRIEVLCRCLLASREGKTPDEALLTQLKELHARVMVLRQSLQNPWAKLTLQLDDLGTDALVCILASEAQPAIGWLYQQLQGNESGPHISLALMQPLLALDEYDVHRLRLLLPQLASAQLLQVDSQSLYAPLKPGPMLLTELLGLPMSEQALPGAYLVKKQVSWKELVLPEARERALREFLLWLRFRNRVVEEWGGHELGGPVALFSGPSGTGKTFAAAVIASELGWPLYRVDLARLVSKYIGETEKNIGRLFDAAHGREMVLQFDEVDALMSKRGDIKEARDRYANMEVSYLLARIEDHRGPCILTTNLRQQIDKAFARRFQLVVEFPRPDANARERLWRIMLPPKAPLDPFLDLTFVAKAVNLTGGNIRNAALHAAYLAAESDEAINLEHIATATYRELCKDQAQLKRQALGPLAAHLPDAVLLHEEAL